MRLKQPYWSKFVSYNRRSYYAYNNYDNGIKSDGILNYVLANICKGIFLI